MDLLDRPETGGIRSLSPESSPRDEQSGENTTTSSSSAAATAAQAAEIQSVEQAVANLKLNATNNDDNEDDDDGNHLYEPLTTSISASNDNDEQLSDFLDEDILLALQSLQMDDHTDNNNNNNNADDDADNAAAAPPLDDPFDPIRLDYGALENLEVNSQDQQEGLLPLQDFSNVFEESHMEQEQQQQQQQSPPPQVSPDVLPDIMHGTPRRSSEPPQGQENDDDEFHDNGQDNGEIAPWDFVCRPCEPNKEDPVSIQYGHFQQLSEEEQLQLSLQAMSDDNHFLDGNTGNNGNDQYTDDHQQVYEDSFQSFIVSRRREAVSAAISFTRAFGTGLYQPPPPGNVNPTNERSCFGHKETIYCVDFSECGTYLASASQDATVCIWNVATNSLLTTLTGHNKEYECLRVAWAPTNWSASTGKINAVNGYFIASGGADGVVKIWFSADPSKRDSWECVSTLDHGSFEGRRGAPGGGTADDVPQIYALQFIDHWKGLPSSSTGSHTKNSFLMTSSDDYVHLWDMEVRQTPGEDTPEFCFSEVFSIRFTGYENLGGGVTVCNVTSAGLKVPQQDESPANNPGADDSSSENRFGGPRNPNNLSYVFDASYCPGNGLLGVALSDGTMRIVNGRGVCVAFLSLPGIHAHLTSFSWDTTGSRLASCVGSGQLILWRLHNEDENAKTSVSCVAVLEGGHQTGTPLFGARYCGIDNEDLILTWGVDGRLCLWDSESHGQIHAPISTLVSRLDYPIYAVDISTSSTTTTDSEAQDGADEKTILSRVAVGGGRDAGFVGMPLYMYNVEHMSLSNDNKQDTSKSETPATDGD